MKVLGTNIRLLRKRHKMSQKDLAAFLDVSQTSIAHYEKGSRQPTIESLRKISKHFQVSIDELVGNTDEEVELQKRTIPDMEKVTDLMYELLVDKKDVAFFEYISQICDHYNLRTIIDEMLKPVLFRIGYEWEIGAISEVDEHYASHIVRRSIQLLSMKKPHRMKQKRAIAVTVHSEQHTLGIEMVCAYLENMGIEALYLGRDIPMRSLNRLIMDYDPDYLFISVTLREHLNSLVLMLNVIMANRRSNPVIGVGGQAVAFAGEIKERFEEVIFMENVEDLRKFLRNVVN